MAGIILFLIPKSPAIVIGLLVVCFLLLIHPIWYFWWIEDFIGRRIFALVLLAGGLVWLGWNVWPSPSEAQKQSQTAREQPILQSSPGPSVTPSTSETNPTIEVQASPTPTPAHKERIFIDKPEEFLRHLATLPSTQAQEEIAKNIGKWVKISGSVYRHVREITIGSYTGPIMSIITKAKYPKKDIGAYCERFAEEWKADAALSDVKDAVTLRGRVIRIGIPKRRYWIVDCEFVE